MSIGSTGQKVSVFANDTHQEPDISGSAGALRTQESRFPQILIISHIAEIQGGFANTPMVEMGTDNSSRVREVG